jgi:uncharacterized iron-regulated membrane protein
MKWHHWAGLIGGLFLTTWIISGWWSVNPFRWFDTPSVSDEGLARYAGHAEPTFAGADIAALGKAVPNVKQASFYWLQGKPLVATDTGVRDPATGAKVELSDSQLFAAAQTLMPAKIAATEIQTADDNYWYSHHEKRPLPVLKAIFSDPAQSWIYIDPTTGEVLDINNASSRAYRWVFAGLHQMDFRFLVQNRPAWDITLWLLGIGGVITSISGVVVGWRRLTRKKLSRPRPHAVRG